MENVISDINLRTSNIEDLKRFYNNYSDDILGLNILFVLRRCTEESIDIKQLNKAIKQLNQKLYGGNTKHSYILQAYKPYLVKKPEYFFVDKYNSLERIISKRYSYLIVQSEKQKHEWLGKQFALLCHNNCQENVSILGLESLFVQSKYVQNSTSELQRMIINAVFSFVFEYNIDDSVMLAKKVVYLFNILKYVF